ncbi:MAG: 4-hydroxythreonine-4-phosphate dehydrogenase PdxA [Pseudomonadales bacterium]|nr:4-hydroxythreonine-4-phosphate dehydrogenase PdxA [Pseudomonadales bacterium]
MSTIKRLALTSGEPAGIGPDLCLMLASQAQSHEIITLACPELLQQRAKALGLDQLKLEIVTANDLKTRPAKANALNQIKVLTINLPQQVSTGQLNVANATYVLQILDTAIEGCVSGLFNGMVTAPVQKSIICEAGYNFSGHTEYLADKTQTEKVVMMLATEDLRVALVTTHIPLKDVAAAIDEKLLKQVTQILHDDLKTYFGLENPRILVAGLNPHAGEDGHLGREEIDTIIPALNQLRKEGFSLQGPLPADTLFTPKYLANADAVLAMYHDQGLPVLKFHGFGQAANITLGLPIIRTSVDHGTALDLAGTGNINPGSLLCAINIAATMATAKEQQQN